MSRTVAILKMHTRDKWMWFFIPWAIMLSSFAINLVLSFFIADPLYTGGVASIYIYMMVAGIISISQTFPYAIGMNLRRKDFYAGTSLMAVLVSVVTAVLLFAFARLERGIGAWGTGLHFFDLPYLNAGPMINQLWIPLAILLFVYFLGFAISSIYRRMGRIGMMLFSGGVVIAAGIVSFMSTYFGWWPNVFSWMSDQTAVDYALYTLPFTALFALISYWLLRRATV